MARKRDYVQPRRWAHVENKHKPDMTENYIDPDEARAALLAILNQVGVELENIQDYDPRKDLFKVTGLNAERKRVEAEVPGETVAKVVKVARTLWKNPHGLIRPSHIPPTKEGYEMLQNMLNASGES